MNSAAPNPAHPLDGGIPLLFHIARQWPAASDVRRWPAHWERCVNENT